MEEKMWLARSKKNKFLGPFLKKDLIHCIHQGELLREDEVCESGDFWFFLYEDEMIKNKLSISEKDFTKKKSTQTSTHTKIEGSESLESSYPSLDSTQTMEETRHASYGWVEEVTNPTLIKQSADFKFELKDTTSPSLRIKKKGVSIQMFGRSLSILLVLFLIFLAWNILKSLSR